MQQKKQRARPGRPGRPRVLGEKHPLSVRVSPETKEKLEGITQKNGRSLSQEAEYRLEQSFEREQRAQADSESLYRLIARSYGSRATAIAFLILEAMDRSGAEAKRRVAIKTAADDPVQLEISGGEPDSWLDDPYAYSQAANAVLRIVSLAQPAGGIELPVPRSQVDNTLVQTILTSLGEKIADKCVAITVEEGARDWGWAHWIRPLLGGLRERLKDRLAQENGDEQ